MIGSGIIFSVFLSLLSIVHLADFQSVLRCYVCEVRPPARHSDSPTRLCSQFDQTILYTTPCPESTFCLKKTYKLKIQDGSTIEAVERGCAPQTNKYQTNTQDGRWQQVQEVDGNAYAEGCFTETSDYKASPAEFCYCKDDYCNGADVGRNPVFIMTLLPLLVLLSSSYCLLNVHSVRSRLF